METNQRRGVDQSEKISELHSVDRIWKLVHISGSTQVRETLGIYKGLEKFITTYRVFQNIA